MANTLALLYATDGPARQKLPPQNFTTDIGEDLPILLSPNVGTGTPTGIYEFILSPDGVRQYAVAPDITISGDGISVVFVPADTLTIPPGSNTWELWRTDTGSKQCIAYGQWTLVASAINGTPYSPPTVIVGTGAGGTSANLSATEGLWYQATVGAPVTPLALGTGLSVSEDGTTLDGPDISSYIQQGATLTQRLGLGGQTLRVNAAGDAIVDIATGPGSATLIGTDANANPYFQSNGLIFGFDASGRPTFNGHAWLNSSGQITGTSLAVGTSLVLSTDGSGNPQAVWTDAASPSFSTTLNAATITANRTITLPNATGTVTVLGNTVTGTGTTIVLSGSPGFTGTPTVPTATAGTNTTQAASTAFVASALSTAIAGVLPLTGGTISGSLSVNGSVTVGTGSAAGILTQSGTALILSGASSFQASAFVGAGTGLTGTAASLTAGVANAVPAAGITGTIPIPQGGTGSTSAAGALAALGALAASSARLATAVTLTGTLSATPQTILSLTLAASSVYHLSARIPFTCVANVGANLGLNLGGGLTITGSKISCTEQHDLANAVGGVYLGQPATNLGNLMLVGSTGTTFGIAILEGTLLTTAGGTLNLQFGSGANSNNAVAQAGAIMIVQLIP